MARYIDAEPILKKLAAEINKSGKYTAYESGLDDAYFYVNNAPTADVQEVNHGTWVCQGMRKTKYKVTFIYHCSRCFRVVTCELDEAPIADIYPYCHCGAKMDGDDNE